MIKLSILLQAAGGGAMQQMMMILMIIVVFYFFMIRPQMKKTKLEKQFKESIKKGDKVVTIGGVHGKIIEVQEKTFILEIADDIKVKIEKSAISADVTKQYAPTAEVKKYFFIDDFFQYFLGYNRRSTSFINYAVRSNLVPTERG